LASAPWPNPCSASSRRAYQSGSASAGQTWLALSRNTNGVKDESGPLLTQTDFAQDCIPVAVLLDSLLHLVDRGVIGPGIGSSAHLPNVPTEQRSKTLSIGTQAFAMAVEHD